MRKERSANEVEFANHMLEFIRFYNKHKDLCDEISGIKKRIWYENGEEKSLEINAHNFLFAIKRVESFVIDNVHYIKDRYVRNKIEEKTLKLEEDYSNDVDYNKLKDKKDLTEEKKIEFNRMYFNYIIRCFNIAHEVSINLQSSLMIGTKDIKKNLKFHNSQQFFENLAKYRDEMSNDIANYLFKDTLKHMKKIMGYHYTYRIMISKKKIFDIDYLMRLIFSYVMNKETLRLMFKKGEYTQKEKEELKRKSYFIKMVFMSIYKMTNEELSDRNILPKVETEVLIDKTLI